MGYCQFKVLYRDTMKQLSILKNIIGHKAYEVKLKVFSISKTSFPFFVLLACVLCILPRSNLGPGSAGFQVHPVQAPDPQEMSQTDPGQLRRHPGSSTAPSRTTAEHRKRKWERGQRR